MEGGGVDLKAGGVPVSTALGVDSVILPEDTVVEDIVNDITVPQRVTTQDVSIGSDTITADIAATVGAWVQHKGDEEGRQEGKRGGVDLAPPSPSTPPSSLAQASMAKAVNSNGSNA